MGYYNPFYHLRCWCQKVLPTVYDDSLSYYEFLGKICKKVNDLGDIVNNIINTGSWNAIVAYTRPEFFGGIGDGNVDDTEAVLAAVEDARKNNKILLLAGTYKIYNSINVPSGLVVMGQNGGGLLSGQQNISGFVPTTLLNISNPCSFINVKFDGGASVISSSAIGDINNNNPLVKITGGNNIVFNKCLFENYDTNWSDQNSAKYYSVISATQAKYIDLVNCKFNNCRRDGITFDYCEHVKIEGCDMDRSNTSGSIYSEINIFGGKDFIISGCTLKKKDDNTNSIINAMGDDIVIDNCDIENVGSKYGIDYGNEVYPNLTMKNLYIRNNRLHCPIRAKVSSGSVMKHENIVIENNDIICTNISEQSGVIIIGSHNGEHYTIRNNNFYGTLSGSTSAAIRFTGSDSNIVVDGNNFMISPVVNEDESETVCYAIQLNGITEKIVIKNCYMECNAIRNITTPADDGVLSVIGCRTKKKLGYANSGNGFNMVCVGCDMDSDETTNNINADVSLSNVRPSAGSGGGDVEEEPAET